MISYWRNHSDKPLEVLPFNSQGFSKWQESLWTLRCQLWFGSISGTWPRLPLVTKTSQMEKKVLSYKQRTFLKWMVLEKRRTVAGRAAVRMPVSWRDVGLFPPLSMFPSWPESLWPSHPLCHPTNYFKGNPRSANVLCLTRDSALPYHLRKHSTCASLAPLRIQDALIFEKQQQPQMNVDESNRIIVFTSLPSPLYFI